MNRISALSILTLFGRTALLRMVNRSALMKFPSLKKKTTDVSKPAVRTATLHRREHRSLPRRVLGMWLPLAALFGMIMLSLVPMFVIVDSVLLSQSREAPTLCLSQANYQSLEKAAGISNKTAQASAVDKAFAEAYSSPAPWLTESAKQLGLARFEKDGMRAFEPVAADSQWNAMQERLGPEGRRLAQKAIGGYLVLVNLTILCMTFGLIKKNLSGADPELVWLWQFPVSRRVLIFSKLVEYCVGSPAVLVTTILYATVLSFWGAGFGEGLALGALLGVAATVTTAALRLAAETFMTQRLSRRARGAVVAVVIAFGSIAMLAIMTGSGSQWAIETFTKFTSSLPAWSFWNPFSAGVGTDAMVTLSRPAWWLSAPASAAVLALLAVLLSTKMTKSGLACGQNSARDSKRPAARMSSRPTSLGVLAWKELLQLRRHPEGLAQVLAAPLMIWFLLYVGGYKKTIELATSSGTNISMAILVAASYMLIVAAAQTIGSELKMLWLLQCQPRPLADVIRTKARIWAMIAIGLCVPFIGGAIASQPAEAKSILFCVPFLVAALWSLSELMFGLTALSASITGERTVRFRRSAILIPLLVMSYASMAITSQDWWLQVSVLAVLIVLNAAVRHRMLVELAWLSEPAEMPPKQICAMDGLLALVAFQSIMGIASFVLSRQTELSYVAVATISYCTSAIVMGALCWLWLRSNHFTVLPRCPRGPIVRPVFYGLSVCCAAGLALTLILNWLEVSCKLPALVNTDVVRHAAYDKWFLLVLWVVAAPIFEEWLFRGLLYRTLRRIWGVGLSVAVTALLFATVHPVAGCAAILTLGTMTALAAEKTGRLWPSIMIHAGYNLLIWSVWVA